MVSAVGAMLGLTEPMDPQRVEAFRKLQAEAKRIPELLAKLKKIGERLEAAKAAVNAGAVQFEGVDPRFRRDELATEFQSLGVALSRARQAEVESVGMCPDEGMQAERRTLIAGRKELLRRIERMKREREDLVRDRDLYERNATAEGRTPSDAAPHLKRVRELTADIRIIDGQIAEAGDDRMSYDASLENLKQAMLNLQV